MRFLLQATLLLAAAAAAHAQPPGNSRGALLYSNHCGECHSVQMHWRAQRLARDWNTLQAQVKRWQGVARLNWSDDDIEAVTRHLNDTVYGFPRSQARQMPAAPVASR